MDFNPDTWGNVAEWVGSVGTTLAFVATFIVIRRDADVRRRAQARKVVFVYDHVNAKPILLDKSKLKGPQTIFELEFDQKERRLAVMNLSDEPIYDVYFRGRRQSASFIKGKNILLPNDKFEVVLPAHHPIPVVHFRDNSGQGWTRAERGMVSPIHSHRLYQNPEALNHET